MCKWFLNIDRFIVNEDFHISSSEYIWEYTWIWEELIHFFVRVWFLYRKLLRIHQTRWPFYESPLSFEASKWNIRKFISIAFQNSFLSEETAIIPLHLVKQRFPIPILGIGLFDCSNRLLLDLFNVLKR